MRSVTSRVDYCNAVLAGAPRYITDKLQRVLNAAARLVTGTRKFDRGLERLLHDDLHWLDVLEPVQFKLGLTVRRCLSTTQSSPVPGGLLYVRRLRHQSSASTFRQSSARRAASPSQHVRPSGLRSGWSNVLELITEQSPRVGV